MEKRIFESKDTNVKKFVFELYNYLSEHGFKNENISSFIFYDD